MNDAYTSWKNLLPKENEIFQISTDRKFTHDESLYGSGIKFLEWKHGYGVMEVLKSVSSDKNGPAIEIGAGNGLLSVTLAEAHTFTDLIISDASSTFVEICKSNIIKYAKSPINVSYAVFNGDDIKDLPENSFSLICMANALHHIEDFEEFVMNVSEKLKVSGAFVCQEPISDGFLMLGLMIKSYLTFTPKIDKKLAEKLEELALTMSNSNRRDMDKSYLEDKHIFNIYELQRIAAKANMKLTVFPNLNLDELSDGTDNLKAKQQKFSEMCKDYIQVCLNWDQHMKNEVFLKFEEIFQYIDIACGGGFYPPVTGVFCMVKAS